MTKKEARATVAGGVVGTATGVTGSTMAISTAGSVSGLSAAGMTSGLAAIGGTMIVGVAIAAIGTVTLAALGCYAGYRLAGKRDSSA